MIKETMQKSNITKKQQTTEYEGTLNNQMNFWAY